MRIPLLFVFLFLMSCVQHDLSPDGICKNGGISLKIIQVMNATKCGSPDGGITVEAVGGRPPYAFHLGQTDSNDGVFNDLLPGGYTITVTDDNGCEAAMTNVLIVAEGLLFETAIEANSNCTGGNGSVTVTVNEGTSPMQFRLGDGEFSGSSTFTSLRHGEYQIQIRDGDNCTATLSVNIPRVDSGVSWKSEIQPLMTNYCALKGCHNGTSRPDLRLYEKAKLYASQIKQLTQNKSMPFEGSLTDDQIALIACWVDEGAKDN